MADFLDSVLKTLADQAPQLQRPELQRIERTLRQHWGGTEAGYIRKRLAEHQAQQLEALGNALRAGRPLRESFVQAGVSRSRGFELLRKRA